jgi:hypothetical protein
MAINELDQSPIPPPTCNIQLPQNVDEARRKMQGLARKRRELDAPSMTEIEPGLFIGNARSSYNRDLLGTNHVNAIVSLTDGGYALWHIRTRDHVPEDRHKRMLRLDSSIQDILVHLKDICDFIDHMAAPIQSRLLPPVRNQEQTETTEPGTDVNSSKMIPGVILVHCTLGISRSRNCCHCLSNAEIQNETR